VTVRYLDLADYLAIAAAVTGLDIRTIIAAADLNLADSALHSPAAGFGDTERYPTLTEKAAVLLCRLAWNHPLPDGNKRAAWASLRMFLAINNAPWTTAPGLEKTEYAVLAIAARQWTEDDTTDWLRLHLE
jgi:death-on-curing protein